MGLRDTITAIKMKDAQTREQELSSPRLIEEWQSSVESLYEQVLELLSDFTSDGSIVLSGGALGLSEEFLGEYLVPILTARIGEIVLHFHPVARVILGGTGRVDLFRQGRNAESDRVMFIRDGDGPASTWSIRNPNERQARLLAPLDRPNLEAAIEFVLDR